MISMISMISMIMIMIIITIMILMMIIIIMINIIDHLCSLQLQRGLCRLKVYFRNWNGIERRDLMP